MLKTLVFLAALVAHHQQSPILTGDERKEVVEALARALDDRYVFDDLGKRAAKLARESLASGSYDGLTHGAAFAERLSADLNAILKDAHFRVRYSSEALPRRAVAHKPTAAEVVAQRKATVRQNAGFQKVERLHGNIGYIEVTGFHDPELFAAPCAAAFDFLASTDALILDLRRNGGGHPGSVRILCSYLFGKTPVHLNSLYFRETGQTSEFWTLEDLPGARFVGKPVYVLTSKRTGSGAEECAYNIQSQKRGPTVGESTWGGANPGGVVRLSDHFSAFVPTGRAINPITKTNWEGVGVQPDVPCEQSEALKTAQVLAIEELMKSADPDWKRMLQQRLEELKVGAEGEAAIALLQRGSEVG